MWVGVTYGFFFRKRRKKFFLLKNNMSYFLLYYFYFYTKSKKGGVVIHICICYPLGYSSIGQEKVGYTLLKVGLGFFSLLVTTRIVESLLLVTPKREEK